MSRLDQLMARNLGATRSEVTRWLRGGRVTWPDGTVIHDGGTRVGPRVRASSNAASAARPSGGSPAPHGPLVQICLDGTPLELFDAVHLLQHKPWGVVTALADATHDTAWSSLRGEPLASELRAVGRLDRDATGLLLWTTDGALVHRLTHPKRRIPRTYHVALSSLPRRLDVRNVTLGDGHEAELDELTPLDRAGVHPALVVPEAATSFASITLHEGRFHEVKRIFVELGVLVLGLCRVAYGPWTLPHDLAPGEHRRISLQEPV